jgi:hypothetical protein
MLVYSRMLAEVVLLTGGRRRKLSGSGQACGAYSVEGKPKYFIANLTSL